MNSRRLVRAALVCGVSLGAFAAPAMAQDIVAPNTASEVEDGAIIVTGSRIRQDPTKSALPLEIIRPTDLSREGISNPEQLISFIAANGNGADNLASNSDVVSGAARGTNGLSAANLRGQGSASTLVLLNGRRVAAHGLQGSAVDVNQIPIAAIDRVEILKDGASAIYGTDAIGGVINFITKKDFTGLSLTAFTDFTEGGDATIYRVSGTVGWGKLDEQGYNLMASVSYSSNGILFGRDRDFVNGNQPNRGLSIDTRGTPVASAFSINRTAALVGISQGGTLLGDSNLCLVANQNPCLPANLNPNYLANQGPGFFIPGTTAAAIGGVNPLRLPGGGGCDSVDGGMNYDSVLWANPTAGLACAWDTGRAATLQQPLNTMTYYGRLTFNLGGDHQAYFEGTGSNANSHKIFSHNQYTANNTTMPIAYPLNALTAGTYNQVYNSIVSVLPGVAVNYGRPIAFRFRCIACGPREYDTNTKTFRGAFGIEGPIGGDWEYRGGASYAQSQASSVLGSGYHYRGVFTSTAQAAASGVPGAATGRADPRAPTAPGATAPGIVGLFNSGILNPFSVVQTPEAMAALDAISARGVRLYGGKYSVRQFDMSVSGGLVDLPGGRVQVAFGVDYRRETYKFDGSSAGAITAPDIFNVAFDNVNQLSEVSRDVKAAYAEVLVPVFDMLEVTGAIRVDDYTGFGSTVNPKFTAKFEPFDWVMLRGSYSTGFRVPTFNQINNGVTQSPNPGNTLTDPTTCPAGGTVNVTPGCAQINPDSLSGGNVNLGPETANQYTVGIVLRPLPRFTISADYWSIAVDDVIGSITIPQLFANIAAFPDRITRTNGVITLVDLRTGNFGSRRTRGIDFGVRGNFDGLGGTLSVGFDGTLLIEKKEKLLPNLAYSNLRGVFSFAGDLGLKWKHNAWISFAKDDFTFSFSQIYRSGYTNQALPLSSTRPDFNAQVKPYIIYNMSVSQRIDDRLQLTLGVKNLFDTDPPFAITYDSNLGAGSSWEPRVADPRGRSFNFTAEVKF
jgi:iron complex outermembrane recepter protein